MCRVASILICRRQVTIVLSCQRICETVLIYANHSKDAWHHLLDIHQEQDEDGDDGGGEGKNSSNFLTTHSGWILKLGRHENS